MKASYLALFLLVIFVVIGALPSEPTAAQSRPSCEWSHSIAVTASAGASAHLEEIKVDLGPADFPAGYSMSADGADLRIYASDNTTPIPFVISRWDVFAREATVYIRPPAIGAGSSATYNFFLGNPFVAALSDANQVFPVTGLRVLSRVSGEDPMNGQEGHDALRAASSTVADVVRSDVFRINNQTLGGAGGNFGLCVTTMLNVLPGQEGLWSFRGGFDFGRGGHFLLDETEIAADWNDDLFWAFDFNDADVLQGNRTLDAGWHKIEALGFEGCCDGPIEIQARAPGGSYLDLRTSNFPLRAATCANLQITISTTSEACPIGLDVDKASVSFADTIGTDFALPGATVTYEITVANIGQRVNDTTIEVLDSLPADARLIVTGANAFELVQGSPISGVTLDWGGPADASDGVEFSIDGTDFSYEPQPGPDGTDNAITHVRFVPDGSLNRADNANQPSFVIRLQLVIN